MTDGRINDPMLDMFIFEGTQLLEQLEQITLRCESLGSFDPGSINEIFRIMHTIKGSSAMMMFDNISALAHVVEDLFYFLREEKPKKVKYSEIINLVLSSLDFIKVEIGKIEANLTADGNPASLIKSIEELLAGYKHSGAKKSEKMMTPDMHSLNISEQKFYLGSIKENSSENSILEACVFFEDGCQMENIRAFTLVHNMKESFEIVEFSPADILENEDTVDWIRASGFRVVFKSNKSIEEIKNIFFSFPFIIASDIQVLDSMPLLSKLETGDEKAEHEPEAKELEKKTINIHEMKSECSDAQKSKQNFISVNLTKLDMLMDLVGEIVIAEAMVTRNPELKDLKLNSFKKASRQLRKLTSELQDMVMAIRMVPLTATFQKMNRIVRDMGKKLDKDVELVMIGEDTEVDKNIIESLSDPLMHLIRNSLDHGLEEAGERLSKGKPKVGRLTLEAKNSGGDVWIIVKDDGRGLNREKILSKAREQGLVKKQDSELSDKEIFNLILLPGFSTKDKVTEFSGRGVGMDVVLKNVEKIGGSILIDSISGAGTAISIKIPLTLAIIDGMVVSVGKSSYVIPITAIRESFKPKPGEVIKDPDGNEMIVIRGQCYPVIRLHRIFNVDTPITCIEDGIIMMIQNEISGVCLMADALIGEQEVVVKALPNYLKKVNGIAGCTMLGDGSVSLILDTGAILTNHKDNTKGV